MTEIGFQYIEEDDDSWDLVGIKIFAGMFSVNPRAEANPEYWDKAMLELYQESLMGALLHINKRISDFKEIEFDDEEDNKEE